MNCDKKVIKKENKIKNNINSKILIISNIINSKNVSKFRKNKKNTFNRNYTLSKK